MATAPLSVESRRAPRDLVSFRAQIDAPGGARVAALMVDISPYGFMARCQAGFERDGVAAVKLPIVGVRAARIVWSLGGRVGAEFLDPIPAALYAMMLKRAPHDRPAWNEA